MHIFLLGGIRNMSTYQEWYEKWLKEPILETIRFHQNWLLQDPYELENRSHQTLKKKLKKLEVDVKNSTPNPNSYYQYLQKLVEIEREYTSYLEEDGLAETNFYSNAYVSDEGNDEEETTETHTYDRVPIGKHQLPPLPYAYNALEPYIDEQTMYLHHDEHHKKYVEDLNKAEKMLEKARITNQYDLVKHWERELAFNGAGHYLHTLFWETMRPNGGGEPTGSLKRDICRDFGSFHQFKKHFSQAAEKVEGGGWAILVYSPRSHRLEILQAEKHQNLSQWDVIPLLPLDVWEHAYYLKYPNKRKEYIKNWWNVVNWPAVQERYRKAKKLTWKPY
jgi:Fe-Mn family superoxide dismutase